MSDFLTRLAERQLGQIEKIEPRVKPLFAPTAPESQAPSLVDEFVPQPLPHLDEKAATSRARPEITDWPGLEHPNTTESRRVTAQTPAREQEMRFVAEPVKMESERTQLAPRNAPAAPVDAAMISPISAPAKFHSVDAPKLETNAPSNSAAPRVPTNVKSEVAVPPPRINSRTELPTEREIKLTVPVSPLTRNEHIDERARPVAEAPVQVTIGRIEVTALVQAAPSRPSAPARKPNLSLDDYLARRHGRER
jgi:hypothetical protein